MSFLRKLFGLEEPEQDNKDLSLMCTCGHANFYHDYSCTVAGCECKGMKYEDSI